MNNHTQETMKSDLMQVRVKRGLRLFGAELLQEKHLERAEFRRGCLRRRPSVGAGESFQGVVTELRDTQRDRIKIVDWLTEYDRLIV
jgi:hypothetical protein